MSVLEENERYREHLAAYEEMKARFVEEKEQIARIVADWRTQHEAWEQRQDAAAAKGKNFAEDEPVVRLGKLDGIEIRANLEGQAWADEERRLLDEIAPDIEEAAKVEWQAIIEEGLQTPVGLLTSTVWPRTRDLLHDVGRVRPDRATRPTPSVSELVDVVLQHGDVLERIDVRRPRDGAVHKVVDPYASPSPSKLGLQQKSPFGRPPDPTTPRRSTGVTI